MAETHQEVGAHGFAHNGAGVIGSTTYGVFRITANGNEFVPVAGNVKLGGPLEFSGGVSALNG
jgi:hypothetical protein